MSHTVTVTRTTTTSSTSVFLLNIGYLKKIPGILKAVQIAVGIVCVALSAYYVGEYGGKVNYWDYQLFPAELFFLLVTTTCLITTSLLLITCLISIASSTILPKTVFEIVYHGVATLLLVTAATVYIIRINQDKGRYSFRPNDGYNGRIAASVFGFINAILYGVACFFSWRAYKGL